MINSLIHHFSHPDILVSLYPTIIDPTLIICPILYWRIYITKLKHISLSFHNMSTFLPNAVE